LVSTQLDAEDLLRAVCAAFGLTIKDTDKASLLAQLEQFLKAAASERKRALLLVDEAQNLTPRAVEELRMLSNFQVGEHALLQSFLVGQPELRRIMQSAGMQQFRQRVIASYHLGPLDRSETQGYIEHRVKHVGWKGDPKLEAAAYDAIFAFTAGIPRRVNLVCNRLMLAGFLGEIHTLSANDVETVVSEIKDELGVVNKDGPVLGGDEPPNEAEPDSTPDLSSDSSGSARTEPHTDASVKRSISDTEIEARLARLEKTLGVVLTMLRRLLRAVEPAEKHADHARS
jgi:hypothetical protein